MKIVVSIILGAVLFLVGGCSPEVKETLGVGKTSPDEFEVISNPPLSIPSKFRMPDPEQPSYDDSDDDVAKKMIFPKAEPTSKFSTAEQNFLNKAGTKSANPKIKQQLIEEASKQRKIEKDSIINKMYYYGKRVVENPVIDPEEEKKKLEQK